MTTTYHTPHVFGAPLTSEEINRPLAELDEAIDSVVLAGSGTTTTLTATANAGQPNLTVASSAGFAVGDSIWIGDPGGTSESGTILSVPSGTQITLDANLANTYASGKAVSKSPAELVAARGGAATLATRLSWLQVGVFNVKAYGATGDGTTNDRAALQAAFDACHAAGGGLVIIPAGTYVFDDVAGVGLELPYPATILGAGPAATVLSYTGATGTAIRFKDYATAEQRLFVNLGRFSVTNAGAATGMIAMDLKGLARSWVHDLLFNSFVDASSCLIKVDGSYGAAIGAWWNTFERIHAGYCGTGILLTGVNAAGQANQNVIRDCDILGATTVGIDVDVADTVYIVNCDLSSQQGGDGIHLNDLGCTIQGCRFEANPYGIHVYGTANGGYSRKSSIKDCTFSGSAGTPSQAGILIDSGAYGIHLDNNFYTGTFAQDKVVDESTNNDEPNTHGGLIPIVFAQVNIAASQSGVALVPAGADPSNTLVYVGRPYSIRGITYRMSNTISAGTLTVKPSIGGTPSPTLAAIGTAGNTGRDWQGIRKDYNSGPSGVGAQITTDGSFAPTTADITVVVWIEWSDE